MFERLRRWYQVRQMRRAIANIRAAFATFGHDLSDLTDDEVAMRVHCAGLRLVSLLPSVKDWEQGMTRLSQAAREATGRMIDMRFRFVWDEVRRRGAHFFVAESYPVRPPRRR